MTDDGGQRVGALAAVAHPVRIAFLGYGIVGRALHALLEERRASMRAEFALNVEVVGIASRRLGWRVGDEARGDIGDWLRAARPDVVFEAITLEPHTGQPAVAYLRAALESGAHAISANKGPVVHAYRELDAVARRAGRHYRFESAVMDGAPVFSLIHRCLPLAGLRSARGLFTSTANIVLESVEQGGTLATGILDAQRLGIAEADPSYDVVGLDTAVKLCAIGNVLLGGSLTPGDVDRQGITMLDPVLVRRAREEGAAYRLVGRVWRDPGGTVCAMSAPERLVAGDPLHGTRGTSLAIHWEADVFPGGLTVTSHNPDPTTTAYGMFADFLDIMREER